MANRMPLKDISDTSALRRSHRLNGVIKPSCMASQSKIQAPVYQKYCKVISSRKPSLRRGSKVNAINRPAPPTSKRPVKRTVTPDFVVIDIDDPPPLPIPPVLSTQSLVGVKPEDVWLCSPTVAHDMYLHAKSLESRHCFSPDYLSVCGSRVTNEMRATLINWLVEIHGHLKLEPETLYITVRLLDATLQHFRVGVTRLQLCGLAVFWLATKLESRPLNAQDLLYLMCYKGDVSILVRMEQTVLKMLDFQLQVADPIFFLNRLMLYDENGQSEEFYNTCTYCMDSILHDITTVEIPASDLASAALLAGRLIDGCTGWPQPIGYATGHWPSPKKLEQLALKMIQTILEASEGKTTYTGAYKKYASRKRFYGLSESQKFSSANLNKLIQNLLNSIC